MAEEFVVMIGLQEYEGQCYHKRKSRRNKSSGGETLATACGLDNTTNNLITVPLSMVLEAGMWRACKKCYPKGDDHAHLGVS